ncbi:MAG: hypothetical protein HY579_08895 [Nitrospinae bacterium]|nr:hypothetical protein [Nitrospinota bacterium]
MESAAGSIYAMEEVQGLDALLAEEGFKGSFQTSTNMVDTSASTGWTYDSTNKLYKNATGATGANADQDYAAESNYEYYAESGSSATVSGNTVTISGATFGANVAGARMIIGANEANIVSRDSSTQVTVESGHGLSGSGVAWSVRFHKFASGVVKLNSASGTETSDQSQTTDGESNVFGYSTSDQEKIGQTFTAGATGLLTKVDLKLSLYNSPTDSATVAIYNASGDLPAGSPISSVETIASSSLTSTPAVYSFTFATAANVTSGTTYAIVLGRSGSLDVANAYYARLQSASPPYTGGRFARYSSSAWTGGPEDMYFTTYVRPVPIPANEYVPIIPAYANLADVSSWSDVNSLARTETLNSANVYYLWFKNAQSSWGANTELGVFDGSGTYRRAVINSAGTWQYNSNATYGSETLTNATANAIQQAIRDAMGVSANRMTGATMAGVGDASLSAPTGKAGIAAVLYSTNVANNPQVDQTRINYDTAFSALDLRTREFPVSAAPSRLYVYAVDKQVSGTPSYYATRDGGAGSPTWVPVTMSPVMNLADGRTARRGALDMAGAPTGTDIRMKVTAPAGSTYEVSAVGLESRR